LRSLQEEAFTTDGPSFVWGQPLSKQESINDKIRRSFSALLASLQVWFNKTIQAGWHYLEGHTATPLLLTEYKHEFEKDTAG
jgi:hypothetical protein